MPTEEQLQERAGQLATSLATLVRDHRKPVLFDMALYLAVGFASECDTTYADRILSQSADLRLPQIKELLEAAKKQQSQIERDRKLIEILADALIDDEAGVCPCYLAEIGYSHDGWIFVVAKIPTPGEAFVLNL